MFKRILAGLALAAGLAFSQTPTLPTDTGAKYQPSYYLGAGANYDYLGKTPSVLTVLGVKIAPSTYNVTSLNTSTLSGNTTLSVATGIYRIVYQQGNFTFGLLGQGGVATIPSLNVNVGTIGFGGALHYDIGQALKKDHFLATLYFTEQTITSQQVKPVFGITFAKTF